MLPGHVVLWLVSDDHRRLACRENARDCLEESRERHGRLGGGCASLLRRALSLSLVSHHRAAAHTRPSCPELQLHQHQHQHLHATLLARFTLAPPAESLSRGFVIRAIGDAAPPSCRISTPYQAIR